MSFNRMCEQITLGLMHPLVLYGGHLEQKLGCVRHLDPETEFLLKETESFMKGGDFPWVLVPKHTRRALSIV